MRISDWSSDVCSSDLTRAGFDEGRAAGGSQPLFYHYLLPLCPARAKRRARGTSRAGSGLLSAAMRRRVHSHERSARWAVAHPAAARVFVSFVIAHSHYPRFLLPYLRKAECRASVGSYVCCYCVADNL